MAALGLATTAWLWETRHGAGSPHTSLGCGGRADTSPHTTCRIAYHRFGPGGLSVFVMNTDGSGAARLKIEGDSWRPCWSSDGARVCFESCREGSGRSGVYLMNLDGSGEHQVCPAPSGFSWPDCSPVGNRIVFSYAEWGWDGGNRGLYVGDLGAGLGSERKVQGTREGDICASWSPNGRLLVFQACVRTPPGLYVIPADGAGAVFLAPGGTPAWSPTGKRIAYTWRGRVYYIPVDPVTGRATGRPVTVTKRDHPLVGHPAWSPDEAWVAFDCCVDQEAVGRSPRIHKARVDGSGVEHDLGEGYCPHWSPVLSS